jgi:hypothetical protein
MDIVFTEDVIFLMRSFETFDVDVYDYSGRRLYNLLELDWIENVASDTWSGVVAYGSAEGYSFIPMRDGTYGAMDVLTGQLRRTEFVGASRFSDGLAAVLARVRNFGDNPELWGFINKDFELVIPPRYSQTRLTVNGRTVVELPDRSQQVINERGETLFSVPPGYNIDQNFDDSGFVVYETRTWDVFAIYTSDFVEIRVPERIRSTRQQVFVQSHQGGVYSCAFDDGLLLFTRETEIFLPTVGNVYYADGEFIILALYGEPADDYPVFRLGVVALDGREIITPEENVWISPVIERGAAIAFVVNNNSDFHRSGPGFSPSIYRLVGINGEIIMSGQGVLTFDETLRLFSVLGADHFSWLDMDGNVLISIPLMSNTWD